MADRITPMASVERRAWTFNGYVLLLLGVAPSWSAARETEVRP